MCAPLQAQKEEARHSNEEVEKREKEGQEDHNEGETHLPHSASDEGQVGLRSDMCSNLTLEYDLHPWQGQPYLPVKELLGLALLSFCALREGGESAAKEEEEDEAEVHVEVKVEMEGEEQIGVGVVYAFHTYNRLTSVIMPDSVITIGESAFVDCARLPSSALPQKVTTINALPHEIQRSCGVALGEKGEHLLHSCSEAVKGHSWGGPKRSHLTGWTLYQGAHRGLGMAAKAIARHWKELETVETEVCNCLNIHFDVQ